MLVLIESRYVDFQEFSLVASRDIKHVAEVHGSRHEEGHWRERTTDCTDGTGDPRSELSTWSSLGWSRQSPTRLYTLWRLLEGNVRRALPRMLGSRQPGKNVNENSHVRQTKVRELTPLRAKV